MKQKLAVLLALVLIGAFSGSETRALSCLPSQGHAVEFQEAKAVFAGKVLTSDISSEPYFGAKNLSRFGVSQVYKGDLFYITDVETDGTWGMRFEVGKEYLVYLDTLNPNTVALCKFSTTELSMAGEQLKQIDQSGVKPKGPKPTVSPPMPSFSSPDPVDTNRFFLEVGSAILLLSTVYGLLKYFHHKK
jgi:hypothetical protein